MSLMKMRERQQKSGAAKEFRKPASKGSAVVFGVGAALLTAGAIWIFVSGNTLFAGLVLLLAVVSGAISYNHVRRLG